MTEGLLDKVKYNPPPPTAEPPLHKGAFIWRYLTTRQIKIRKITICYNNNALVGTKKAERFALPEYIQLIIACKS